MRIEKINNYKTYHANYPNAATKRNFQNNPAVLTNSMDALAALNKPNFTGRTYELGLSHEELVNRKKHLSAITLLKPTSEEYIQLAKGDKEALIHLTRAVEILNDIHLRLDDENNIPFKKYLEEEVAKGNEDAIITKLLFNAQKGIFAQDLHYNNISLAKGLTQSPGRGYYPRDLSVEEFHKIITEMINKGKINEVKTILNQRSVVERDGSYLKGIDYVDKFKKEFSEMAYELEQASKVSTNADFNEYLRLQAKALRKADPMLDATADIKWAQLQDTPLEFTIARENYDDKMTITIFENPQLLSLLKSHGITPLQKDSLGARTGIVNAKGTEFLKKAKEYLPLLATLMPFNDEYTQIINNDIKQTMVDVDIVNLSGHLGEYRGKITVAENLPNNDKLAIQLGGGRRNVYHKQMREHKPKQVGDYNLLLTDEQKKYMTPDGYHYFTVGHENAHSLGPKDINNLGIYKNIIEENKADVASIAFVDKLTQIGIYTENERKNILLNFVMQNFLKAKPDMETAHRVRQVMQCKYFADNDVYKITPEGKVLIDIDKVVPTAQKMLEEVIRIQINDNYNEAERFINKYFVWTDDMKFISNKLRKISNVLNGTVETPLADYLAKN